MKVRIYKAPDGKGKLVKAKDGMAVNTDKEIKKKIAEGKEPEIIIYEMAEFGLSRDQARDKVYKLYDLLGDDEYDEDEPTAPYDQPVEDEVAEAVVEEEEPDNAAIYDYYGGDNQGLDVVNDGADDEDEEEARYGGQYAEGGQFAPGSIIPKPKKPYYIGMDAEPYDNAYKFGGLTKGAYVKKRIKELRKAAKGDEVKNNETNISPRGTIDSPSGFTSPEKNLASIIKQNANEAVIKQQAENEYQQYQDSTMGEDFNGKFLFGGRNRKIRRANRAMFGTPFAMPGVDVNYEFGPLGGLRKAEANWDLDAIGDLAKLLPGAMNMMPGMFPGVFPGMMPGMMSYKKVSYPAQVRKKTITTINNAALDEVANQNPNSTAAQNNRSDKKNEIKCPPGAVYDSSLGHCVDQEGNMVRSIVDLPDPEELLGNPFENPNARMLNGKKTMKATGPAASASSNATSQSTQARSVGGAPLQSQVNALGFPISYSDFANAPNPDIARAEYNWDMAHDPNPFDQDLNPYIKKSGQLDDHSTKYNEEAIWSSPYDKNLYHNLRSAFSAAGYDESKFTPEELAIIRGSSYISTDPEGNEYSSYDPYGSPYPGSDISNPYGTYNKYLEILENMPWDPNGEYYDKSGKKIKSKADYIQSISDSELDNKSINWVDDRHQLLFPKQQFGGPISGASPDEYGNLQKFIYGGDEYAYGGDVLHKANNGYITNFQKQMNATKDRIDQMGNKKPEELLGNPFRGNAFGNATTGIGSDIKGPFGTTWPNSKPNTGTSTQDGTGTTTNTNQTKTTTTTNQGQPQFDPNTMAQFQQYMQMMQGQPGMGQFSVGRPQRLGFGLTRDFNYTSGFSPVNWQVPEGTKGVKQTSYKDRGKWYNPFDTKKITEWRIDNGEIVDSDKSKSEMQDTVGTDPSKTGTQDGTGTNVNPKGKPGTTDKAMDEATYGPSAEEIAARDAATEANKGVIRNFSEVEGVQDDPFGIGMAAENEEAYDPDADEEEIVGIGNKGEVINSPQFYNERNTQRYTGTDIDGEKMYETYTDKDRLNDVFDITGLSKKDFKKQGPALFGDTQGGTRSELADEYESKGFFGKRKMRKDFMKNDLWDMPLDSGVINERRGNAEIVPNTNLEEEDVQSGIPYNTSGPMSEGMNQGFAYGGYVPEYMAYGGYIPMARSGITAGKPEFEDPNLIGRTVENSAYTFNPGQLATDLFSGPTSLTGLTTNILNARDEAKKMNQAAQMSRTSDAATANTGQSGFGSAERKGSDLMASGNETQYGSTPGRQGYEGGLYGKKGGSMNTQYAKGKVYSLTMDQIKAIEAAGGKVEYIK